MVAKQQVIKLYRDFLRNAGKFDNYNFRMYALRKTRDSFRDGASASADEVPQLYAKALQDLQMLKRQSAISQMYTFEKVVVEHPKSHSHNQTI